MSVAEVMEHARGRGLTVRLADDGENLRVLPSKLITPKIRQQLKAAKPEIVEVLRLDQVWGLEAYDPHKEGAV
jgi:hypothetical protein